MDFSMQKRDNEIMKTSQWRFCVAHQWREIVMSCSAAGE
jgi:hypothetical protein